jgi:hypothetical protein
MTSSEYVTKLGRFYPILYSNWEIQKKWRCSFNGILAAPPSEGFISEILGSQLELEVFRRNAKSDIIRIRDCVVHE